MSHDVFISHSSADKRAADAACALLEARGIKCWIAPRDIRPGSDWGESIINQYKLSVTTAAIPLVMAGPGDGLLDLTGFSSYPTRWVRKGDGNPESLVGFWKTPLLTFVTGSHIVFLYTPGTLEFKADQTYVLHLTRTQTGTLKATNGTYTLTSGFLSSQGNYRFEGSDQFVDIQGKTTAIWKRQ